MQDDAVTAAVDLYSRWKTMQLLGPVFTMTERAGPRANFNHSRYDLAQLALRAIDYVVVNQASVDGAVGPGSVIDHVTQNARLMTPDDPERPWAKVAQLVFDSLLNDGKWHVATWHDAVVDGEEWAGTRAFKYRLLESKDSDGATVITATDSAILLYLQALNTDLANQAMALKLMVELQMAQGEFKKALQSAREATKTARALAASLAEKLTDTRRDVRSVDWSGEMPEWIAQVLGQITAQLARDRQLKGLAEEAGQDPKAALDCRAIIEEVRASEDTWLQLERRLASAIPTFLEAQQAQRFSPRSLALNIDLVAQLLEPALAAPATVQELATTALLDGVAPPAAIAQWGVDELATVLLRPPLAWERADPDIDEPGELGDEIRQDVPADIAKVTGEIFAAVVDGEPVHLSDLLTTARSRAADVEDPTRLCDVVWSAALAVYVADRAADADELPDDPGLAEAVTHLFAVDDGTTLTDDRYWGPDILVSSQVAADRANAGAA